jgi:NAD(P)H dehydrogenase (quinone)
MAIIITGASGQLAQGVIEYCLERVAPSELILVTRTPGDLEELADVGATVRRGDFEDPEDLPSAFEGGERMLLISTDAVGARVAQHSNAIDAAVTAGVELVAYTSILNPIEENPAMVVPEHLATEEKLRSSGVEWTFLRNSLYSDMQRDQMAAAAGSGRLVTNEGSGRVPHVTRNDCAEAAAAVLTAGDHAGRTYDVTGPDLLDASDRVEIFSSIAGVPIDLVPVDDEAFAAGVAEATGMPMEATRAFATFGRATREGYFEVESSDFEHLTGHKPQSLRSLLESEE